MLTGLAAGLALVSTTATGSQMAARQEQPAQQEQQPSAPAASQQALPQQLLSLFETGDPARLRAFVASSFAPPSGEAEPVETLLTRLDALAAQSGGVAVSLWEPRGRRIFFEGVTRKGAIPVEGMAVVADGKILHFEMRRNLQVRGPGAPAWPPAAANAAQAIPLIEAEIDWRARAERFSGAVLIAHRGRPVIDRAWGVASRSPDRPNTVGTLFSTASTTKMLTSAAVARLVDQGKLTLDTSVARAVPFMAQAPGAADVTLRDLLGHRVSYGEYFEQTETHPLIASHERATELLTLLENRAPERAPDGQIAYSNANYLVLAAAIEAATGRSFYDVVRDEVLRPSAMLRTNYGGTDVRAEDVATGWVKDEVTDPLAVGPWRTNEGRNGGRRGGPAGGALSTAREMWQLVDGIAAGRLIQPQTLQAMLADRRRVGPTIASALGFMSRGGDQVKFFGHMGGGGNAGVSTSAFVTPDREWAVVVLSNFSSPAGEMLAGQIMDYLQKLPPTPAE
jgi:CubicO group peptidase (beta-lactamase class C family)